MSAHDPATRSRRFWSDDGLTVETDRHGGATMILPGETEAGSAGTQPC